MKKNIYITLTTFLGALLGVIIIALIEKWIINNTLSQGLSPKGYLYIYEYGYISKYLSMSIFAISSFLGFLLGHKWWKIVYIEKRHWRIKK